MRLMSFARRTRARLAGAGGFTMPAVMGAMLVVMLVSAAAIAAANGDIRLSRYDQDDKDAYAAAEAGVNDYLGHLNSDSNYWAKCTNVNDPETAVSQKGATGSARNWRDVSTGATEYSIELIPAPGYSACDPANATQSMVSQGNIKIRSTGRVKGTNNYRSINATFRRAGFLDFLYYTDFENQSPSYFGATQWADASRYPNLRPDSSRGQTDSLGTFVGNECDRHWWGTHPANGDTGRGTKPKWYGVYDYVYGGRTYAIPVSLSTDDVCGEIQFASDDAVNGPFHSNDTILLCGTPDFGRSSGGDRVEISGPDWRDACSGSAPNFRPRLDKNVSTVNAPATNQALASVAQTGYSFTGQTKIQLSGANMTVTNNGSTQTKPLPPNGVIYIANGTCGSGYNPLDSEARPSGCGDVELRGDYSKDLTIAAQDDIIITANVTKTSGSDAMLGLISGAFVRVAHTVTGSDGYISNGTCTNQTSTLKNAQIDAAILTLQGSFTVDNYWCGDPLGTLTVNGAIAQQHRGVVGRPASGGNPVRGYIKRYEYDDRMRYRSPPYFLDPLQSSWRILRQGEQSPPQRG